VAKETESGNLTIYVDVLLSCLRYILNPPKVEVGRRIYSVAMSRTGDNSGGKRLGTKYSMKACLLLFIRLGLD
jgi:hypothetical protein